jgi:hypothetical protein
VVLVILILVNVHSVRQERARRKQAQLWKEST